MDGEIPFTDAARFKTIMGLVDDELMCGHGIAKLIEKRGRGGLTVPDF